jgi:hypothetical protein
MFNLGEDFSAAYSSLTFEEARDTAAMPWTLVWDKDLPGSRTTAQVTLGSFAEDGFPPMPEITSPSHDTTLVNPDPNPFPIAWEYPAGSPDPCSFSPEAAMAIVCIHGPGGLAGAEYCTEPASCSSLSLTPSEPPFLSSGSWSIDIHTYRNIGFGHDGIVVTEGAWDVATESWGALVSFGENPLQTIVVEIVPTQSGSWGAIKSMYHK